MLLPETYNRIALVIAELRCGETLATACKKAGIDRGTVRRNLEHEPELRIMFDQAVQDGEDVLADTLINIDLVHSDPKMAAVISKNIQWVLARRRPAQYGDRVTVATEDKASDVVMHALKAAIDRIPLPAERGAPPMIDVTPLVDLDALCG